MDLNKYAHLEVLLAPAAVLAFAGLLSVMYGWVGTMNSLGSEIKEIPESPETRIVAGVRPAPAPHIEGLSVQTGIGNGAMVLKDVNGRIIPSGIGGAQGQIRLNNFTAPTGIGNGQILLSGETTIPTGIGNNQMQLINDPPISAGIGGQIRMINQTLVTEKPYLGLEVSAIGEVMARQLGLPSGTGLFIKDVIPHRNQCFIWTSRYRLRLLRLFFKSNHFPIFINFNHTKLRSFFQWHTQSRNGKFSFHTLMKI